METSLLSGETGDAIGKLSISDELLDTKYNEPLIHQVVTAYLAASRAGTKANRSRSGVRGGGRKPVQQKGSGRARAGTIRSPLWRGGGVTFARSTRNFAQKVNKKMYRGALRSMFAELVRQERLVIVDTLELEEAKTRFLAARLNLLGCANVLIVAEQVDKTLYLAARNLPHVDVTDVAAVDPVALVSFDKILITKGAMEHFERRLS